MRKPVLTYFRVDPPDPTRRAGEIPRWVSLGWCVVIAGGLLVLLLLCFSELALLLHPMH
jgi:hypothetical protein